MDSAVAYVGLGANLGDPARQVRAALAQIDALTQTRITAQSPLYRSVAIGLAGQPNYCNAVCRIETKLPPEELFEALLSIERAAGRVRDGRRWGPRTLDLDLLLYGDLQLTTPRLTLPHPEVARRNFVLVPLCDIAPQLQVPGVGRVAELAVRAGREGLSGWNESASV